jgi:signal transduction histidine kinase
MGGAIVLPWGLLPQTVVATCVAVAYTQLPAWFPLDAHAVHEHAVSLFDILALSVIGAWTLDRQRRAVFAEREQGRVILRRQQLLLDAASELNASLDVEATVATIARMAERTFDVDTIALVLVDEARGVLRTAAVVGDTNEADRETENLEIPLAVLAPLVDEIRRRQVVCVPDALAEFGALIRERFGVRASLYAAIEHESTLLGYLVLNYRRGGASFDQTDATLARGFATCCAIALAKSRLVTDLRRADRVKNEFVSTMSHELRTPLHVILGYADLLDDVLTDPEGRRGIDRIRVAGRELLELIEATLDVNRLESGEDAATLAPVAVRDLWDELGGEFTALPHAESVRLVWQVEDGLVALADRRKLKIIVKNLVGNALKFTRAGEVVASAVRDGQRCVVRVCDTGIGIPPEHLGGIFEKFRQVDSSDRRSFGGVGLGLYIVRKLVEQLGGTVEVASTVGRGTTFTITLPLASARGVAAA